MASAKPMLNMVLIGNVNSGKSNTAGHLIYKYGSINQATIEKYETEGGGKGSKKWVLEKLRTEREKSSTTLEKTWQVEFRNHFITLVDVPGHEAFVKNMIMGTSQADCALLIVSAGVGEFEAGMSETGHTRAQVCLACNLAVKELIVGVNKMDSVVTANCEGRFEEIKAELSKYFQGIGYDPSQIPFVPISALHGDNISDPSENMGWFKGWRVRERQVNAAAGRSLTDALEALVPPRRPTHLPLRIPIERVNKVGGIGTVAWGLIETGEIKPGMTLVFAPTGLSAEAKKVVRRNEQLEVGQAGDDVSFNLKNINVRSVARGHVAGDPNKTPPRAIEEFMAQMVILYHPTEISNGYSSSFECHTASFPCTFKEIKDKIDRRTGNVVEVTPKSVRQGEVANVTMTPVRPVCVEAFSDFPSLGRVTVRDGEKLAAVGIITELGQTDAAV